MSVADVAVAALLAITVATTLISCWALLLFKDLFQRMHYLSVVTTVSTFTLLVAVVIKEGWGQATVKTLLAFFVLLLINAVLTHATARAARARELGDWLPGPDEDIPVAGGDR